MHLFPFLWCSDFWEEIMSGGTEQVGKSENKTVIPPKKLKNI